MAKVDLLIRSLVMLTIPRAYAMPQRILIAIETALDVQSMQPKWQIFLVTTLR